jgi:carbon monoxide dehydrogenase subunit G
MARYTGIVEAPHSAEDVWHYLADLRSVREWDPSVDHVELVDGEARTESALYELELCFRGRALTLPYRTAEVDAPHRVVFTAGTDSVSIRDEARIEPLGPSASTVTWNADVRLRGIRRVIDLLLRAPFKRIGQHAERGLGERLRKPVLTPESDRVRA